MKTLYLIRHAKGENSSGKIPDFRRSITDSGREDALKVAESLKATEKSPSAIISSPALRARQTASVFAGRLGYRTKAIRTRKVLYDQDENVILGMIKELDPGFDRVMFVGHNPSLSDLAQRFCDEFKDCLPTSGAIAIEFEVNEWPSVGKIKGALKLYEFPKRLVKSNQKEKKIGLEKSLEKELTGRINSVLEEKDKAAAELMRKPVRMSIKKLVRQFIEGISRGSSGKK